MSIEIKDTIVLKCETQKNFNEITKKANVWDLLLSVATTYSYKEDKYSIWTYTSKDDLIKYLDNKNIVVFNGMRFELPLLFGFHAHNPDYVFDDDKNNIHFVCCDIFMRVMQNIYNENIFDKLLNKMHQHPITNMQSYSLFNIYCNTLNTTIDKNLYNIKPIDLFKSKNLLSLIEYNLFKTRMIKKLYEWICKYHYIINGEYDVVKINQIKNF